MRDFKSETDDAEGDQQPEVLHDQVHLVYGMWEPDDEQGPYRFELNVAVKSLYAQTALIAALVGEFGLGSQAIEISEIDGVEIEINVLELSEVSLADFENRRRISEWDLLSGLKKQS